MTEDQRAQLRADLYEAFLAAAIAMGDDIKTISWFGRNHRR